MIRFAIRLIQIGLMTAPGIVWAAAGNETPVTQHEDYGAQPVISQGTTQAVCTEGVSSGYPCRNVQMLSRVTLDDMGGISGNDSWGWKDPATGRYYAIMGLDNGVSFVDITDPEAPEIVGKLPSRTSTSNPTSAAWRDLKTYKDHLFVVADGILGHGMQVFDLTRLRNSNPPEEFTSDKVYF